MSGWVTPGTTDFIQIGGGPRWDPERHNVAKAGAPQVTNVNEFSTPVAETAFQQAMGKINAGRLDELEQAASASHETDMHLARFEQYMSGVETGRIKPLTTELKAIAKGIGVPIEELGLADDVGPAQAMKSITGQMALKFVAQTKGAISNREWDSFHRMVANLGTTPEGNKLIIEAMRAQNRRTREVAQMARNYVAENKVLDSGFFQKRDKYIAENPLFTEDFTKRVDNAMHYETASETKVVDGKTYYKVGGTWFEKDF